MVGQGANMEHVPCIFCTDSSSEVAIEENGFTGRRCLSCGLIFVSPRPSPEDVIAFYEHDQAYVSAESLIRSASSWSERRKAKRIIRHIRRYVPGGRLLELGPGGGAVLVAARAAGFDPVAVEPNPIQADAIRTHLGVRCATSLDELDEGEGAFDVVFHGDVLSHLSDPIGEFRRLHAILREGGLMAFETGNLADVEPRLLHHYSRFQYPDHLYFFGDPTLDRLLASSGFVRVSTRRYSILPVLRVEALLSRLGRLALGNGQGSPEASAAQDPVRSPASIRARVVKRLSALAWTGLYGLTYGVGAVAPKRGRPQTLLVVARKGAVPVNGAAEGGW
jgi:SAM-dependent methyltransferase